MYVNTTVSKFTEVVVRVIPSARRNNTRQSLTERNVNLVTGIYEVLIYSEIQIPGLDTRSEFPPEKDKIAGLPYIGSESIKINWDMYQDYLSAFIEGEKAFFQMRERLFETLPTGLGSLFEHPPTNQPVRLWLSTESPELDELPWELLLYQSPSEAFARFTLVRGLPPENLTPIIPITNRLRVALIYKESLTPPELLAVFTNLDNEIEFVHINTPLRKALEQVATEGFEIVHIVSDCIASLGFEGILYMHDENNPNLQMSQFNSEPNEKSIVPTELSSIFSNSRASILCLSPQNYDFPNMMETVRNRRIRSVFRAFAYLGNSKLQMPSIVAPLGPLSQRQNKLFWEKFYSSLNETLSLQQAMMEAQSGHEPFPVALFLHHFQIETFRRAAPETVTPETDPVTIEADLQFSKDLLSELSAHQEKYGKLSKKFDKFVKSEQTRQKDLDARLNPWFNEKETKNDY